VDIDKISATTGGKSNFALQAGPVHAYRTYVVFGGLSGTSPGTPLPGGSVTLPINWDLFTNIVINMANSLFFHQFLGKLDGGGDASATLNLPPVPGAAGLIMYFAFALNNPWDFASNAVDIHVVQ
jgi:hypothetical protein